ncbi:general stress protein 16U [Brevibacillus reuszeri]|uniref:Chemical-damaging agent resistance protein C n=1 Tax=Brevibacillus reuszeri TaxID=54915 RepID=A0A0K9Z1L7_9BACL|nr:TerD family protein [Brevibacillus reuszeri]KNB74817.1 chemical-damaging agent resistance protein C [Brevibacillus reuszeri]MED1859535.1 TerD family protein [Brevibacillus reuszeri]GED71965.1 general stress protein 16U [Brevibacillus reuszeri]
MAVSLQKGQKVDLTKTNPGLVQIHVGLGWDTNKYDGGQGFDLDASVFLLNDAGKVLDDQHFIFFNNATSPDGSVVHSGDNRTGEGEGDDEVINIDLSKVAAGVQKISFAITIYDAQARNQNFGQVSNAYARVVNPANNEELLRYDLGEDFSIETAIVVGELYRNGGEWKFSAIGSGYKDGLAGLARDFGVNIG